MSESHPANHFSLRSMMSAIQSGVAPESFKTAMRQHIAKNKPVYVFDDRKGEAEQPSWILESEAEIQEVEYLDSLALQSTQHRPSPLSR